MLFNLFFLLSGQIKEVARPPPVRHRGQARPQVTIKKVGAAAMAAFILLDTMLGAARVLAGEREHELS
jgi:hypothetical protein